LQEICGKYEGSMKKYEGNMREGKMKKYEGPSSPPYIIGPGYRKIQSFTPFTPCIGSGLRRENRNGIPLTGE